MPHCCGCGATISAPLDAARRAGEGVTALGGLNPAATVWRTEAALALHALGEEDQAREVAAEELKLARHWGAPRALGRALRINGLLAQDGEQGLALLAEAEAVLAFSPARLEHARALADLGAALRRARHAARARIPLRQSFELATRCGALLVADQARSELHAAGGRPHRTAVGPDGLTPSEQRIAQLAVGGATNRDIAQTLFITPKTVETHLSHIYRKLGITTRTELPAALTDSPPLGNMAGNNEL